MIFNEYCTLNLVEKVHLINTKEGGLQQSYYGPSIYILFVGTKEEEDVFKGMLAVLGYNPTKVKRFDDVHTMFNVYNEYSMRTFFFSTQEHIEKSGMPYHT